MITLNFDKFIKELMLGWRKSAVEDLYDYNIMIINVMPTYLIMFGNPGELFNRGIHEISFAKTQSEGPPYYHQYGMS